MASGIWTAPSGTCRRCCACARPRPRRSCPGPPCSAGEGAGPRRNPPGARCSARTRAIAKLGRLWRSPRPGPGDGRGRPDADSGRSSGGTALEFSCRSRWKTGAGAARCARRRDVEGDMRLLLVEDDRKAARLLTKGLSEEGFVVDVAYSGEQGDEMASIGTYDVIVLDWLLPGRDGLTVCREL